MSKIAASAKVLLASSFMVIAAGATAADNGYYAGASYSDVKVKADDIGTSFRLGVLSALGGYQINKNFAVEARLGSGAKDADLFGASFEVDSFAAVNGVASYPLANNVSVYGTLGYGQTRLKVSFDGTSEKNKLSAFNYGGGLQYKTGPYAVRLGFESLADKSAVSVSGVTLTGVYNF